MKRKVIQIADSTQLVSIPRKWALKYGVKKGDDIDVEINGNKLVITVEKAPEVASCELDLSTLKNIQRQSISATYLKGYDEVKIKYELPEQVQLVQQMLSEFTGYDIVNQTKNLCVIKQISHPSPEEFPNIVNRLFLLILDTCSNIIEGHKTKETELIDTINFRSQTINKFSNFCLRLINKGRGVDVDIMTSNYRLIHNLKELGQQYKCIADMSDKSDRSLVSFLTKFNDIFQQIYRSYSSKSIQKCSANRAQLEALFGDLSKKGAKSELVYHQRRLIDLAQAIQEDLLMILV